MKSGRRWQSTFWSEERFRSLFEDLSGIAVHGYDTRRRAVYWNRASQILYGYSRGQALGKRIEELILPESLGAADLVRQLPAFSRKQPLEYKVILRESSENEAFKAIAAMQSGRVIALTAEIAMNASKFSLQYNLPMADSMILSTARMFDATIWTQDSDFEKIPGVKFFPKS